MALTPSSMPELGTKAPAFELLNPKTGQWLNRDDIAGSKGLLVIFMCNHCPFVRHIEQGLLALGHDYKNSGIGIVGISANDPAGYPEDAPQRMAEKGYDFPYLFDETQAVAKDYGAACTPDFFLYDSELRLAYRGQFDDSRPNSGVPVTGRDLRQAMDLLILGQPVPEDQQPSLGCNIKWRE